MCNVLSIRSHTLNIFEHVQNNILASAYNNVHRRMSAYEERTRRMPSVPLTYVCAQADPGGAHPARAPPPNSRGPMIFYAQNAIFSQFFFARFARDSF